MKTTGKKINGRKVFTYVFLTIAALISLFPFYFMFVSATNTNAEILSATPKLIFGSHLVENFKNLNKKMDILRILMNSAIMTVTYTALSIILHSMAGYALAKFEFKGQGLTVQSDHGNYDDSVPGHVCAAVHTDEQYWMGRYVPGSGIARTCRCFWYFPDETEYVSISNIFDRGSQNRRVW